MRNVPKALPPRAEMELALVKGLVGDTMTIIYFHSLLENTGLIMLMKMGERLRQKRGRVTSVH